METTLRNNFNQLFNENSYQNFINTVKQILPDTLEFRMAETPVFIPNAFKNQLLTAVKEIVEIIKQPNFKKLTQPSLPSWLNYQNEGSHPEFLVLDFGVCAGKEETAIPQLIEMQGFPSLFAFQVYQDQCYRQNYSIPSGWSTYLNNFNAETYVKLLRNIIIGNEAKENVILLELYPEKQKTKVDFLATKKLLQIETVCLTEIYEKNGKLFYKKNGNEIAINSIYNRIIFDEIYQNSVEIIKKAEIVFNNLYVNFIPHPSWFYRISKYTLPFINSKFVPETHFLSDIDYYQLNLNDYVLKPLFSFAGQGVIINIKETDIKKIDIKSNWILQKKANYIPIIKTPDGNSKLEIRLFLFWPKDQDQPILTNNLSRLSKGDMIGVRYNIDKTWVGSSACYFQSNS